MFPVHCSCRVAMAVWAGASLVACGHDGASTGIREDPAGGSSATQSGGASAAAGPQSAGGKAPAPGASTAEGSGGAASIPDSTEVTVSGGVPETTLSTGGNGSPLAGGTGSDATPAAGGSSHTDGGGGNVTSGGSASGGAGPSGGLGGNGAPAASGGGSEDSTTCGYFCTERCASRGGTLMPGTCSDASLRCCDTDFSEAAGGGSAAGGSPAAGGPAAGGAATGGAATGGAATGGAATGGAATGGIVESEPIPVAQLPIIEEMPDPLTMNDGTPVTTAEQWAIRRQEMIRILEDYEYGHMPPPPGNVQAATITPTRAITVTGGLEAEYRMLRLAFGPEESLGFDLGIFTPSSSDAGAPEPYPILIALTYGATQNSLMDASAALSRGYAVATVPYQQLGADSADYASSAFFPAYPEYDWRDISAWAWGISRAVDYLVSDPALDPNKIMITGVSRLGQAVLVAGAFDERIALSAPVAGGMAFRFSGREMGEGLGQGITEIVDQNTYWFGPRFPEFRNQTERLPCDQHWLPALTAPRLFIMSNSLQDEYGRAYAAVQTYLGAKPVYQFLGVEDSLGQFFREGGHGCTSEDWSAILDFADQYLLEKGGSRRFDVLPPEDQLP